jgi:hypothetical protein
VDFIERALKHNPTTSYFAGPLAAAYGKLGMENKSNQAFNTFLKAWGDSSPLIAWVVYLYPFQDEAVLEHLADGFAVAGAREGLLERYLKLTPETRLSGQEIKSLFFGHTIRGRDYWSGRPWTQVRTCALLGGSLCIPRAASPGKVKAGSRTTGFVIVGWMTAMKLPSAHSSFTIQLSAGPTIKVCADAELSCRRNLPKA